MVIDELIEFELLAVRVDSRLMRLRCWTAPDLIFMECSTVNANASFQTQSNACVL